MIYRRNLPVNTYVVFVEGCGLLDSSIITVLVILSLTVLLLVFEVLRIDVVALLCMLALGWSGVLTSHEVLSGFSSNAVIVMMTVMIMGRGIDKTGIMDQFSRFMLTKVGQDGRKLRAILSVVIGLISGFIQNIGAVALFLPGVLNISRRARIPASGLIMPLGFAAILGGTLTMVGSGPLILINDLLRSASLPPYNIFSVTPVGILLLISGVLYFYFFSGLVLPKKPVEPELESPQEGLIRSLNLPHSLWHYSIPPYSPIIGQTLEETGVWEIPGVNILAVAKGKRVEYAPWRQTRFEAGEDLVLMGEEADVNVFADKKQLVRSNSETSFQELHDPVRSGFAEIIIPHGSEVVGKTIRQYAIRRRYVVEPVLLFSKGEEITGDFSDREIIAGDSLIVHGLWERIADLKGSIDFVVATSFEVEKKVQSKQWLALGCFLLAIILSLTGFPVSMAFLSGAVAMVLLKVLSMNEAYRAIEWKVVFLIAGLIPLGVAMQKTGTATFLAEQLTGLVMGSHVFFLVVMVAVLSTLFSLVMSNVGAIVVLAPLVIELANLAGVDPRPLALMSAVCVANSFILPTHQVNALIMSPGGYRNTDFFKAGSGMTLLFLFIAVLFFYFVMM